MSEIEKNVETSVEPSIETPLVAAEERNTEMPVDFVPQVEKMDDLPQEEKPEAKIPVNEENELEKLILPNESMDAEMSNDHEVNNDLESEITKEEEPMEDSLIEDLESKTENLVALREIAAVEHVDVSDKIEVENIAGDIENEKSPIESPKLESEESLESASEEVNKAPELSSTDSSLVQVTKKLNNENTTESTINIMSAQELEQVVSEESSEATSENNLNKESALSPKEMEQIVSEESWENILDDINNEPELSTKEVAKDQVVSEDSSENTLEKLNENADTSFKGLDQIVSEESSENTADKLINEQEETPMEQVVSEESSETLIDKLISDCEQNPIESTESFEEPSSKEVDEVVTDTNDNKDDQTENPQTIKSSKDIEVFPSPSSEADIFETNDQIKIVTDISVDVAKENEEVNETLKQIVGNEENNLTEITKNDESKEDKDLTETSKVDASNEGKELTQPSKEETENKELSEPLELMDTYDSQESIHLVIDETSNAIENKDEVLVTKKDKETTNMEVDDTEDITETHEAETEKSIEKTILKDLSSEIETFISKVGQVLKETTEIKEDSKNEDFESLPAETAKDVEAESTEEVKEKEISSKEKSSEKDILNKSKDDDCIPVEQPPVPIIEIDDDDFETDIITQTITKETATNIETKEKESSTKDTDIEMVDKENVDVQKESSTERLLDVVGEKSLEEASKPEEIIESDNDLDDTTDEVFYNKECINYECAHKHKQYFKVPQFALSYFKVAKKKFKTQYICAICYDKALDMYEDFCGLINAKQPLLMDNIPTGRQEFVEIIDSSDDEDASDKTKPTESTKSEFSKNDLSLIEMELHNTIKSVLNRVEIQNQLTWSKTILSERLRRLQMDTDFVDNELKSLQRKADKMHEGLYSCPKIKIRQLQPLDLNSGKLMAFDSHQQKEVQPIPPVGEIERPPIKLNSMYYAVKNNAIASWVPCKVVEQVEGGIMAQKNVKHYKIKFIKTQIQMPKTVPAKYLAYFDPPTVRLPIGTRVIAFFDSTSLARGREKINVQSAFYPGIIAEPLKPNNKFRYLIFYDDGYTQYVYHKDVRLVCHVSDCVWEDVHPASRDFIQKYLTQYSINRPMVQTQKGQSMNTESNGYWLHARVVDIDCSLVLMQFEGSKSHTEWIYRGSLRLGPVFKEYQKTLQKNSNMPVSRLPRRTEPFIRYTEDEESSTQQQTQKPADNLNDANRAVARKTFGRPESMMNSAQASQQQVQQAQTSLPTVKHLNNSTIYVEDENKPKGKVVYYTAKRNLPPRKFKPHKCSPACLFEITHNLSAYSPLSKPLLSGWERFIIRQKIKKVVTYRAPCGKIMRHMKELHNYLRITNNVLNVDNFDFSHETNCLAEYVIETTIVQKRDISNGQEKMAIPLVNYYDNTLPPECKYSAKVIPTEGVHINTDKEFLVGCDCDDDCMDKTKCACWQLTLTGAKYGNPNAAPEEVGYQYRRLLDHVPTGIYECNPNCKCKSSCLNRVVQNSLTMKLQVFKTSNRGWGLRCINDIPRGSFVCVYAGHLLTEAKANEGGQDAGDEYFAELDYIEVAEQIKEGYESEVEQAEEEESYQPEFDDEFTPSRSFLTRSKQKQNAIKSTRNAEEDSQERQVINFNPNADMNEDSVRENSIRKLYGKDEACYVMDAKISGNLGRYFNHSCAPNMFVQNVFVDTHDLRFPHVAFFSSCNIRAGTELTWNYNYEVGVVPGKVLYCQCGAANCRLRLL